MTTFLPPAERSTDERVRRSRGFDDRQTRHSQPSVGTPIDVPEPRTVSRNAGIAYDFSCPLSRIVAAVAAFDISK